MPNKIFFTIVMLLLFVTIIGCTGQQPVPMVEVSTDTITPITPVRSTDTSPTPSATPASPTATPTLILPSATPEPTSTSTPPPTISFPEDPSEQGDTIIRPADGMTMVYVPPGSFIMGSFPGDEQFGAHSVTLDGFWIDQTEVTNAQFADFLNVRGNQFEGGITWLEIEQVENAQIEMKNGIYQPEDGKAKHPAVEVSWFGITAYCHWVGGRLPTEAEWEYAARGPDNHVYPWGDDPPTCNLAQFASCGDFSIPVGSLEGDSWVGAKDMAGNVWEWTADYYAPYPLEPQENPTGPETGEWWNRAIRGGSYLSSPDTLHTAYRLNGGGSQPNIGFRCAASAPNH